MRSSVESSFVVTVALRGLAVQQAEFADVGRRVDVGQLDRAAVRGSVTSIGQGAADEDPQRVGLVAFTDDDGAGRDLLFDCGRANRSSTELLAPAKRFERTEQPNPRGESRDCGGRLAVGFQQCRQADQRQQRESEADASSVVCRPADVSNAAPTKLAATMKLRTIASNTPRTRPRTSRGRSRCKAVYASTSTTIIPAPEIT